MIDLMPEHREYKRRQSIDNARPTVYADHAALICIRIVSTGAACLLLGTLILKALGV